MSGPRSSQYRRLLGVVVATVSILGTALPWSASALESSAAPTTTGVAIDEAEDVGAEISEDRRPDVLGDGWETSDDVAWTLAGEPDGLRVLVADIADGYRWRSLAKLSMGSFDTDRWIGNACLTGDAKYLGVVFAPRGFANDDGLLERGAFAAVVNVSSGEVAHVDGGFTLAYFNPGCGSDDHVVFSSYADDQTRLVNYDADNHAQSPVVVDQRIYSAIPADGMILGTDGSAIVTVGADNNEVNRIADTTGVASNVTTTADGSLGFLVHDGEQASVMYLDRSVAGSVPQLTELASGPLLDVGLAADSSGNMHITGSPTAVGEALPASVSLEAGVSTTAEFSSTGRAAIEGAYSPSLQGGAVAAGDAGPALEIDVVIPSTDSTLTFSVATNTTDSSDPSTSESVTPRARGGFGTSRGAVFLPTENGSSPVSEGSPCAVPRNDPRLQAMQPRPAEVEWAVDQAVRQTLHPSFPLPSLSGGGRVPAQIMLGILAQESNFWQASRYAVPGVPGNPLVGNYYGYDRSSADPAAWWQIDDQHADCGYGIAQVTTGMRQGDMPIATQELIATDFKANIGRGLQILIDKWNQTRAAGLIVNSGNPMYLENWFYALWAYNTGLYEQGANGQPWGVGWLNNPINPLYPPNRHAFLDGSPADAATPQQWPYPERVLGFAANSAQFLTSVDQTALGDQFNYATAFTPGWWPASDGADGIINRATVKPPIALFCDASNNCNPTNLTTPCSRVDSKCWFHKPASWKSDCPSTCGREFLSYSLGEAKPSAATSFPANCSTNGLPSGALIIDNLPSGTASQRPGCTPLASAGSFQFTFPAGQSGSYPGKIDVHQLGSGFNGQFFFSHVRIPGTSQAFGGALAFSGKWTLGQTLSNKWAQIYVHMPNHGAWTQQANYVISTGTANVMRSVNQRNYANQWVSLGTLLFNGIPSITLANDSGNYTNTEAKFEQGGQHKTIAEMLSGVDDIAWDAVAFVPLSQKPTEFIVSLGDSYSSGEGTSVGDGSEFFRGSDHHGARISNGNGGLSEDPDRNACHRSYDAWPYLIDPPGIAGTETTRTLAQAKSPLLDFQLLACSGAETKNVTTGGIGQYGELAQLDRGFIDANTTLVTMTIGGNDVGFGPVIKTCIFSAFTPGPTVPCQDRDAPKELAASGKLGAAVDAKLGGLQTKVAGVLQQISAKAPAAKIVLLGYPTLFATGSGCVSVLDSDRSWLNSVATRLNAVLTAAASAAGPNVRYQSPQYQFQGSTLCTPNSGLTSIVFSLTKGDLPLAEWPGPGPQLGVPYSQQSVHPNDIGSSLYATVANTTLRQGKVPLSATLVGGAATTYYSTFRIHVGGPVSMNVSSFSTCGQELRLGLRLNDGAGSVGQQHTDSLSWTSPQAMQNFTWTGSSTPSSSLPAGAYAVNARLVAACAGGGTQSWSGVMYW